MIQLQNKSRRILNPFFLLVTVFLLVSCSISGAGKTGQLETADGTSVDTPSGCGDLLARAADRVIYQPGLRDPQEALRETGASIYALDLEIGKDMDILQGCEQVRYTNQETIPLGEVYFLLYPNTAGGDVTIHSVSVDGTAVEPAVENRSALRVTLPAELEPGQAADIQVDFTLAMPEDPGGNYGLLGFDQNVLLLNNFYPVIAVYDDEGWNLTIPSPYGDTTYLDASFYLVRVVAPEKLVLASSGVEVTTEQDADSTVFAAGPVRDFYLAGSVKAKMITSQSGDITIRVLAGKDYEQVAGRISQYAADAIRIFSDRFGAYPYREMDFVLAPFQAMGMEYPGAILIANSLVSKGRNIDQQQEIILEAVVAHEVAHQWFYNMVGSDQVDEPWLDEAFAQYSTYLYYLDLYGKSAANSYRSSWYERWERVDQEEKPIGLPSGAYGDVEYVAIVYGRGPLFVQALEEEMGQEVFAEFLRDYATQLRWKTSSGDTFHSLAEQHCQCDLSEIFEEWVLP